MILLDTSVLIWLLTDHPRLGPAARDAVGRGRVHVSSVTVAELTIKAMLGKITIPDDLHQRLPQLGFESLPLTDVASAAVVEFPELARHDPFDRLLIAQAHVNSMHFYTSDRVLLGIGRDFIIDATA